MKDSKEYLTKQKFEELTAELENLRTVKRKEVAENLEYAKGLGDLAENAEYHEAREMQATIEDRIHKLEEMLKSAVIVPEKHGDTVNVGSVVTVKRESGDKQTFTIVGSEEVNAAEGKISVHSPLGSVLVGKKKSDAVKFNSPSGKSINYTVVEVK